MVALSLSIIVARRISLVGGLPVPAAVYVMFATVFERKDCSKMTSMTCRARQMSHCMPHARALQQTVLDFSKFESLTPDLYLIVSTANESNSLVGIATADVARAKKSPWGGPIVCPVKATEES
jgi:hypothetical protein